MNVKIKSILESSKLLIQKGWTQKEFARNVNHQAVRSFDKEACYWCLAGAVNAVTEFNGERIEVFEYLLTFLQKRNWSSVARYNDHKDTKVEDIISLLDEAIKNCK